MKKKSNLPYDRVLCWLTVLAAFLIGNSFTFWAARPELIRRGLLALVLVCLMPLLSFRNFPSWKMRVCNHGSLCLRVFRWVLLLSLLRHLLTFRLGPSLLTGWIWSLLLSILVSMLFYWMGIVSVLTTSVQLGIGSRVAGVMLGKIPLAQLFMVGNLIRVTTEEVNFETDKHRLNRSRKKDLVCRTRYPLLLVHGVFFRDDPKSAYWGRIPGELRRNGATVYYGNHQSADSVSGSGLELSRRIREICRETGCEKVNIIAHSKGGLDCRAAISDPETAAMVASLTTISTPHRGCQFADYLLSKIPGETQLRIAATYNTASKKRGDYAPDFMGAVSNLTSRFCSDFDANTPAPEGVFCQSVGSRLDKIVDGPFPLNFCSQLVKYFDGVNDGLVGESSFRWGDNYIFLSTDGSRGISHGDVVDQTGENIPGFDVREFYVQLVADLKARGF